MLHNTHRHIRSHVVRVIPDKALQIGDMRAIQRHTQDRPRSQHRPSLPSPQIQAEDPNRRIIQAVHDARAGREVIQLLRELEIPGVEDHAEDPAGHAEVGQQHVVRAQGVGVRDGGAHLRQAALVREEVEQGEEHGEGLLHAEEAVERPLAVELDDGLRVGEALRRDDVLACVVALGGAVPEEDAVEEG